MHTLNVISPLLPSSTVCSGCTAANDVSFHLARATVLTLVSARAATPVCAGEAIVVPVPAPQSNDANADYWLGGYAGI